MDDGNATGFYYAAQTVIEPRQVHPALAFQVLTIADVCILAGVSIHCRKWWREYSQVNAVRWHILQHVRDTVTLMDVEVRSV
jgi:hypothetical protein